MATRDLSTFFEDGALEYPGVPSKKHPDGKTYKVPSPDGRTGLFLSSLAEAGIAAVEGHVPTTAEVDRLRLDDDEERSFYQTVLGCEPDCGTSVQTGEKRALCGSTYDQLMDDGAPWSAIQAISRDAWVCFGVNQSFADALLETEGKAHTQPNRVEKRAASRAAAKQASSPRKAGSNSPRASGAKSTRSTPASTRGSETSGKPGAKAAAKKTT